jgi:hypothetical protein
MIQVIIDQDEARKLDPCNDPGFKPRNCYVAYAARLKAINALIEKKHPGHFIKDITRFERHPCGYHLFQRFESEAGFTPEEYKEITGRDLSDHPYTDIDWKIDIVDGKVCKFRQSGNISMNRGAPAWTDPVPITSTAREVGIMNFE